MNRINKMCDSYFLNGKQKEALAAVMRGDNVFITGGHDTGKTYVANCVKFILEMQGKNVMMTAPTEWAAFQVDGVICKKAFMIPEKEGECEKIYSYEREVVYYADVVMIDEVSKLRLEEFEYIVKLIETVNTLREKHMEFTAFAASRIQLIVIGDFFQTAYRNLYGKERLKNDQENLLTHCSCDAWNKYAFNASGWKRCQFTTINLTEFIGIRDPKTVCCERELRLGNRDALKYAKARIGYREDRWDRIGKMIYLCKDMDTANTINFHGLEQLPGETFLFDAIARPEEKGYHTKLRLKVGAPVMALEDGMCYKVGDFGVVTKVNKAYERVSVLFENNIVEDVFDLGFCRSSDDCFFLQEDRETGIPQRRPDRKACRLYRDRHRYGRQKRRPRNVCR